MKPNVIFVLSDQHRHDFIGFNQTNGKTITPNMDNMAEQGIAFNRAYCVAPVCTPSRLAIASGRYPANSGLFTNLHEMAPGAPSFVKQLRNKLSANEYNTINQPCGFLH